MTAWGWVRLSWWGVAVWALVLGVLLAIVSWGKQ